ncbi:MAG: hypothetical protein ACLFQV_13760, partial [Vulcanimicrobiota bacterium]
MSKDKNSKQNKEVLDSDKTKKQNKKPANVKKYLIILLVAFFVLFMVFLIFKNSMGRAGVKGILDSLISGDSKIGRTRVGAGKTVLENVKLLSDEGEIW